MTDYQKLVDILMDETPEDSPWFGRVKDLVEKLIANGVTFATDNNVGSKWIPVTERLPKEFVSVLVYIPSESPLPMVKEAYLANGWWATKMAVLSFEEITHWMEMPEPPKGE